MSSTIKSSRWRVVAIPLSLRVLLLLPTLGLPAYWWSTYSGLYRWFAELQMRVLGSYEAGFTVILCALPTVLGSLAVVVILGLRRTPEPVAGAATPDRAPPVDLPAWLARARAHPAILGAMIIAPVFLVVAGYFLFDGVSAGSLSQTTASALEAGSAPPTRYTVLEGRRATSPSAAIETEQRGRRTTTIYVPIVSSGWTERSPVAVFLAIERSALDRHADDIAPARLRGVLTKNGLPGLAHAQLENQLTMTNPYWVLEYGASPEESFFMAAAFGTLGVMLGCGVLVGLRRVRRRGARGRPGAVQPLPRARVL